MGVPWTARGSNQSILKEISPGYSLERLMLKLKLQYFGHLMLRTMEVRSEERRVGKECQTLFLGAPKSLQMVTAAMKLKDTCPLEENL